MTAQLALVFARPHSRPSDPPSSATAAESARTSGAMGRQARAVLALVTAHPGLTSAELAAWPVEGLSEYEGGRRFQIARRLPDVERAGLVVRCEHRARGTMPARLDSRCRHAKAETTWFPVEAACE